MDDMNRRVAELRGWSSLILHRGRYYGFHDSLPLLAPSSRGYPSPDYRHSLDACKELIEEMAKYDHVQIESGWVCVVDGIDKTATKYLNISRRSLDICEAICNCYIAWKEAQNG
jgi:hypothetical protein